MRPWQLPSEIKNKMHSKSLQTLEFPKVLTRLADHTSFSAGRALAEALMPSNEPAVVARSLQETREALHLLAVRAGVSLGGAHDVRSSVGHARIGATLQPQDLLDIRDTIMRGRAVRRTLHRLAADVPRLAEVALRLMDESHAADEIANAINDRGEVVDSASPTLLRIRRELNVARSRLIDRLQKMIGSSEYSKYLQEPIITQRGGRYVIPLKSDFKGRVAGIVHDSSASGATLFVEPIATVELNNSLRELELQEQKEVERILAELSAFVADEGDRINWTVESLADLDLAFAKAKYAEALRAREPIMVEEYQGKIREIRAGSTAAAEQSDMGKGKSAESNAGDQPTATATARSSDSPSSPAYLLMAPVQLVNARHPLLNQETVVPSSLNLGGDTRILIITGPNTGGKTVTLKTVGLLALMAQSGMFVPASDGTTLPIFSDIFADIGDEQSIEQSLSTFSSHTRNVIEFLKAINAGTTDDGRRTTAEEATADGRRQTPSGQGDTAADGGIYFADDYLQRSSSVSRPPSVFGPLVLMDELGAGTDPIEGSALAQAILEHLRERNVMALVATHYTELKLYAHATPGVQNASVEFDVETLMPTYRLTVGLPGRSNALAIATRLGLDPQIVEAARERVSGEHLQADALLADLKTARQSAEANDQAALSARGEAERAERQLRERLNRVEAERMEILNSARREAEREIEQVRAELDEMRKRMRSLNVEPELKAERARLDELTQTVEPLAPAPRVPVRHSRETIGIGDRVWIPSLNQRGEVVGLNNDEAEVQLGNMRLKLRAVQLEKETKETKPVVSGRDVQVSSVGDYVPSELHLRGMRAEEALVALEKYLDDAYLAQLPRVRIVHGKGTGALRSAVREMLQHHPLVASFRAGDRHEGEEGVTVAELVGR
jgi:DNA mismatch repair protein MutS2